VLKPEAVTDKGADEELRQYPKGFNWVFVNGQDAMQHGKLALRAQRESAEVVSIIDLSVGLSFVPWA